MHKNMFEHGHTRQEIKDALNQHQKRDTRTLKFYDFVTCICLIFLVRNLPGLDIAAIMIAFLCGVSGMRYFIDLSVRNFYLHRLDWDENKNE